MKSQQGAEFDPYASSYDETIDQALSGTGVSASYFPRYRVGYIRSHLSLPDRSRVLDYGCGTGNLSAELHAAMPGLCIDGFDPSDESIKKIPEALHKRGVFSSSVSAIGSQYDCIILSMVLHHILPAERPKTLNGLRGLLADGGYFVIFEHNPINPITRRIVDRCPFDADAVLVKRAEASALLEETGFQLLQRDYLTFFPPLLGRLDRFLSWCPLGAQYAVVSARK
jgi:SAM-dependent methyltransferase